MRSIGYVSGLTTARSGERAAARCPLFRKRARGPKLNRLFADDSLHRDRVPRTMFRQISVECCGDQANEGPSPFRDDDESTFAAHDAGRAQRVDLVEFR